MTTLDDSLRARLMTVSSATLSTVLLKRGFRNTAIRGVRPARPDGPPMVGPALTMRYIPCREDVDGTEYSAGPDNFQRRAIDTIPEGHVLVMDCRGNADVAGLGAVLARRLVFRKAAGVVLDGGLRDTQDIAAIGLPAFSLGPAAPANIVAHHAADMNVPIACGGVPVYPGDIMFGDGEAVVVIPHKHLAEVVEEAVAIEAQEEFLKLEIEAGKSTFGVYPPDADTVTRYEAWRLAREADGHASP